MKKIIALTIFIFISSFITKAQSQGFTVLLDENMHHVVDMIYSSSGNYILAGNVNNCTDMFITEISPEGETLWSRFYFGQMLWYASIIQKSDGNILIPMSNYYALLLEINQFGDSIRSVTIAETNKSFFGSVIEMPDSSLIATEIVLNDDPLFYAVDSSFLVKLSPGCSIIDKYPSQFLDIKDIILCSDSSIFAITEDGTSIRSFIVKYNIEGQILSISSCTELNPYLYRINRLNNNYFAAVGFKSDKRAMQAVLTIFDYNGQVKFCDEYSNNFFISLSCDTFSETLFILGQNHDSCIVNTLSYSGELSGGYFIDDSLDGNNILYKNNYLYIAGIYNYCTDPRSCFIKLHKDSVLSIHEEQVFSKFRVFPNPASDYVIFENQAKNQQHNDNSKKDVIQIMDVNGKLVVELPFKTGKTIWDTGKIKSGVYFYQVNVNGIISSGKIVISK